MLGFSWGLPICQTNDRTVVLKPIRLVWHKTKSVGIPDRDNYAKFCELPSGTYHEICEGYYYEYCDDEDEGEEYEEHSVKDCIKTAWAEVGYASAVPIDSRMTYYSLFDTTDHLTYPCPNCGFEGFDPPGICDKCGYVVGIAFNERTGENELVQMGHISELMAQHQEKQHLQM